MTSETMHCAGPAWWVASDIWMAALLSHGLDCGGDIYVGGTQGTWVSVASSTCIITSVGVTELQPAKAGPAPGLPSCHPAEWGKTAHHTGTVEMVRAGIEEAQLAKGTQMRQQAQPETFEKCPQRRTERMRGNRKSVTSRK